MADRDRVRQRLGEQMARGEVVLFTGAGFSWGARDTAGNPVPQVRELKEQIWQLIWPDIPIPDESTLGDTYAAALSQARNRLKQLMLERLDVDPSSVTSHQRTWLSMPWRRAYTLNIDNLESAAARAHELPKRIRSISALDSSFPLDSGGELLYVHLNGTLADVPDVTFADPQYGVRQVETSPLYEKLAADLVSYPVVFVGTQLRESLLWQYLSLRELRGARGVGEMRPRSYLVTPDLPRDREVLLAGYNVEWVRATADEFAEEFLVSMDVQARLGHRARSIANKPIGRVVLPKAIDLASHPAVPGSEYLLGAKPEWADITEGRAIERAFERGMDPAGVQGCLLISGTAGSGTSSTLMRFALRASAAHRDVRWIDANHGFDARDLSRHLRELEDPVVVVIDDADTFGLPLAELVSDITKYRRDHLLVLGMRTGRVDQVLPGWKSGRYEHEIFVPPLDDSDIESLVGVLDKDNKLGALKRLTYEQRVSQIRNECGRELLVAMIEATSGEKFEVKVAEEFDQLEDPQGLLYSIAAIASELRFALTRDELLVAAGDTSNTTLYALDRLVSRKLLMGRSDGLSVRHRLIAELVVAGLRRSDRMYAPYSGLLRSIAIRVDLSRRNTREAKLLRTLLSHKRIDRFFDLDAARRLYDSVEDALADDYHFWLQRGALEVKYGSLPAARNYLQQAYAGGEHDFRVETEWAYYLMKTAYSDPSASGAAENVEKAEAILLEQIERRGNEDAHVYHVYGSQMLAWLRRAPMDSGERAARLEAVKGRVTDGSLKHPYARDLQRLRTDIEAEWLGLAIPGR